MWPHFVPLWDELREITEKRVLVAGGYGLFLKQHWLLENPSTPSIVPITEWRDNSPRVTKDVDLVIGLDLLADAASQTKMQRALERHDFKVSEKHARWQFVKSVSATRKVIVELHAPLPEKGSQELHADRVRVKRRPSLGEAGIHGRTNPEATGSDLHAFTFEQNGLSISTPNPVTWSIMKLTAAEDRWGASQDPELEADLRAFSRGQGIKHAQDVCRVVAMVTRDERDTAGSVCDSIRTTIEFQNAARIFAASFAEDQPWAAQVLVRDWDAEHFTLIRSTLRTWFGEAP